MHLPVLTMSILFSLNLSLEYFGMEVEMFADVSGDIEVRVVITFAQIENDWHTD